MRRPRARPAVRLAALVAVALLTACGGSAPPPVDLASGRLTQQGKVLGFADGGAHTWRGIPFAKPPVGALRWKPPQPPEAWRGPREFVEHPPPCPQLDNGGSFVGREDCLYLNVHAPVFVPDFFPTGGERLPVMVFIHGGGNTIGSPEPFDGSRLAAENRVIVVAIQYRLGVLGWFSHPALRRQAAHRLEASGNWATLDMVRALEWVRDNISVFGGDPSRVTVFGESAGGINVFSLMLSPLATGLFHRAISQSGFPTTFTRAQAENRRDADDPGEPASSSEVLLRLLVQEGRAASRDEAVPIADAMRSDEVAAYLRAKPAEELLAIFRADGGGFAGGIYVAPFVIRDGHVIPDAPALERFESGRYNRVPAIVGTNREEHKLFLAFLSPHVRRVFGFPISVSDPRRYDLLAEYGGKLWKAAGADEPAAAMRRSQGPTVFAYRFDWDELARPLWIDLPGLIGAGHAVELLFVFGGTRSTLASYVVEDEPSAEELSRKMRSYWAQFALTGAPSSGQADDLPFWAPWDPKPGANKFMVFDTVEGGGLRMSPESLTREEVLAQVSEDERLEDSEERCEVYQLFVQWSDALSPREYEKIDDGACEAYPLEGRTLFDTAG